MSAQFRVRTATIVGVEAVPVDVEVDVGAGIPSFAIVGLADTAVQEARERVRSALRSSGFDLPNSRVVVNLAPGQNTATLESKTNFFAAAFKGVVRAESTPLHKGKRTHVWQTRVTDEAGKLLSLTIQTQVIL